MEPEVEYLVAPDGLLETPPRFSHDQRGRKHPTWSVAADQQHAVVQHDQAVRIQPRQRGVRGREKEVERVRRFSNGVADYSAAASLRYAPKVSVAGEPGPADQIFVGDRVSRVHETV